ncbi:MAG: hypothetical protein EOP48_07330 [Sphingobacteriales bacterium]|nr:MAG: hypothetical protein EOP48_07330 [Sphingobacteriales bacterium]
MKGAIRFISNYSDGKGRFEIPISDATGFPIVYSERLDYVFRIGYSFFKGGIRFTEKAGGWVCPDLYELDPPFNKAYLSDVLLKNGFQKNEPVDLFLDEKDKEITIRKIS